MLDRCCSEKYSGGRKFAFLRQGLIVATRPCYRPDLVRRRMVCSKTDGQRHSRLNGLCFQFTQTRYSAAAKVGA